MTRISVVTGGAGFIGSHIAQHLLREGHHVRIVDNFATGKRSNIADIRSEVELFEVSITDKDALDRAFEGASFVFHQAALPSVPRSIDDPLTTNAYNVTGTLNVLVSARDAGVQRVIYAASSSAYGDQEGDSKVEDMTPRPLSPYAVSKLAGEYYCQAFTQSYGLETVCLRYFNVFGPRQDPESLYAAVIPRFITAMLRGEPPIIYGDGLQSRDFTFVANVAYGNLLASTSPQASGQVMNLALGTTISLLDLVSKLNNLLGTSIEPVFEPVRRGDIKHSRADVRRIQELLDFSPMVDFDTGLARTVEWYKQRA